MAAVQVDVERPEPVALPQQNAIVLDLDPDALAAHEPEATPLEVAGEIDEPVPVDDAEETAADAKPAKKQRKPDFA